MNKETFELVLAVINTITSILVAIATVINIIIQLNKSNEEN